MEIIVSIGIFIINLVNILIMYRIMGDYEYKVRIGLIIIIYAVVFGISNIMFSMATSGMNTALIEKSRTMMTLSLTPINIIAMITPIFMQFIKLKANAIKKEKFKRNITIIIIVVIILSILEINYVKDIELGMINMIPKE